MNAFLFACIVVTCTRHALSESAENVTKLHANLFKMNSRVRPVSNFSVSTSVTVSFHLMSINSFDTVTQTLSSNGWLQVIWQDEYLVWNPNDYGGTVTIFPDPEKVWRPKLTIQNTMKDLKPIGEDYVFLQVFYDGTVMWFPGEAFQTFCRVDVSYFPFDTQTCWWEIFIWGESLSSIDLEPLIPTIDLDSFQTNGEWDLLFTRAYRTTELLNGAPFPYLKYQVTLKRRPSLLVLNILLPVLVLAVINIYVFAIPSESGERLSYAITVLLSFGVFMSFIMDSMPSSAETVSIVAINLSCLLVLSAVYVLLCILTLQLFHRDDHKHPVPGYVQTLVVWLEMVVCLDPPAKNKVNVIRVASVDGQKEGDDGSLAAKLALKKQLYANPDEMTWKRVSRSLDKLFFRFFFLLVLVSNIAVWVIIAKNYY